ncbi:hypothetical protein TRSC58_01469 [Trypanosoma rangeli SC58]|uniref:RanBP2-type domain-containing protein n=1 Tax=Trypanosoma rangeli SC58 TaxID=429131 RepID=A0A061JBY1_TRYRA|nr:hypothetical protein TRSC58_01469 [Trypanosoma rangeli SC58]
MEEYLDSESLPRERARRRRSSSSSSRSLQRRRHRATRYRRSRSPRRHSSRKRRRSPSRRSSSRDSSYSGDRHRSDRSDSRGRRRSHSRWRRKSGGSRRGGTAAALLNSEPFSVRADHGVLEHPPTDWVCGVCSNPNSVKREECFRCGTRFAVSVNATPSEEIRILGLPESATFGDIQRALEDRFVEHGDTCRIVAYNMNGNDEKQKDDNRGHTAYVLFDSVAEATKALTYARSLLAIGQSMCAMEFSLHRRVDKKLTSVTSSTEEAAVVRPVDGLPEHLQPAVWRPVEHFSSSEEEKEYLDLLSRHWDKLSQEQKDYYDEGVRRALAAQRRKQQETSGTTTVREAVPSTAPVAAAPPNPGSSLDSIKRRLLEKKQAMRSSTSEAPAVKEEMTPAASLKKRLAMKKAQLSSVAKPLSAAEAETVTATVAVSPAPTLTPHSDATPAPMHLFFGFPIPARFPAKMDYLTNSKSPSFRAGLMLRYVPPAVAERIVPPSARPPPT